MRSASVLSLLFAWALSACSIIMPVAEVATRPLDKKSSFEDIQQQYTANIRYGLLEDALPQVEPELQNRFLNEMPRFRELRFSDFRTESIDLDPLRTEAQAVVVYRGYTLSSPYEREIRVVQNWRRAVPTQQWYITPDFDGLLSSKDVSRDATPAPASLLER